MRKYFSKSALAATLILTLSTGVLVPAHTEASSILGNVLGSVIAGVSAMNQVNAQIKQIDNEQRDEFYGQIKDKYGVCYDAAPNEQLDRIMSRLTPVIAQYDPSVKEKPYNYFVNNQTSFNAFCTLGHNLSVNKGLFDALNYQEDEIAFVLGHELAHGTHNDPANGVKKQVGVQVLTSIVASSIGGGTLANLGSAIAANLGTAKGITLPMEKRADKDAFTYCSEAGYNVGAGAAVWQRIIESTEQDKKSMSTINQLFNPSDHPKHVNRRDDYAKTINAYSNKMVSIDAETGTISVNKVKIGIPAAAYGMSSKERSYFVAGDIASVYHADGKLRPQAHATYNTLYLGDVAVMALTSKDDASQWVSNLNMANAKSKSKSKSK